MKADDKDTGMYTSGVAEDTRRRGYKFVPLTIVGSDQAPATIRIGRGAVL